MKAQGDRESMQADDGRPCGDQLRAARAANPKRHRTIIVRPLSVIAGLTTPSVRSPASTIPRVAVATPARIAFSE
jgi:hypothetical protein